jgi:hypothetical protein
MTEYPITFMDEMVRAILDGKKTQTRRCSDRYGRLKPGDILWVKENHYREPDAMPPMTQVFYRADSNLPTLDTLHSWGLYKNYSPMFMPRWASRILLEVVSLRHERLQEITREDASAEGVVSFDELSTVDRFAILWESINGKTPGKRWEDSPWVWVIEFKVVKP